MDSIRENEKLEDMIATIKAELSYDIEHKLSFVLVEGSDDVKFVKKNFCNENVVCYESFSGKSGLEQLVKDARLEDERIIAIRDKDYVDKSILPDRMWTYDTCCLETMMIKNRDVQEGMYKTYYDGDSQLDVFYESIFRQLMPISILRKKNEEEKKFINFNKMRLLECCNMEMVDTLTIFKNVGQDESMHEMCMAEGCEMPIDELYNITNGHDLCKILGFTFKSGKGEMGEQRIRDVMLCAFRKNDFAETELYKDLSEYQRIHNVKYVDE